MIFGVITALIMAMPLAAQNIDPYALGSAQTLTSISKTATATVFSTDVDNYINYHKYSSVKFDSWFGFITGKPYSANDPTGWLSTGYARHFGSLYLGTWYQGNIYQNTSGGDKTVTLTPRYDNDSQILEQTTKTTAYTEGWINTTNQIEFLIGVAGQGIKLGFYESLAINENDGKPGQNETEIDLKNGFVQYQYMVDEYTVKKGTLKPYLGWGTNIAVAGGNLMPYLDVSMDVYNDTQVNNYRDYSKLHGKKQNDEKTSVGEGWNNGYLRPVGIVGAKFDLAKKETIQTTLELKYKLDMFLYGNDYEATGYKGDSVNGTVKWWGIGGNDGYVNRTTKYLNRTETQTQLTLDITEITNTTHTVTPIYKITGEPADGFRVGFIAQVPLKFQSQSSKNYTDEYNITENKYTDGTKDKYSKTTHTNVSNTETSTLGAQLDLKLGASYKLIPDRFTINAGISATPANFTQTVTKTLPNSVSRVTKEKNTNRDGNVDLDEVTVSPTNGASAEDKIVVSNTWAGYMGTISGGFTFNFTPTAALDLGLTAMTNNSFTVDLASVNVLFSIKF